MEFSYIKRIQEIVKEAEDYLNSLDEPVVFDEGHDVIVSEESTFDEDRIWFVTKAKKVFNDYIEDTEGKEYMFYEIEPMSIADLADRIKIMKNK